MKRDIVMLIIVLFCTYTMYADAEEGSIEIVVPVEEDISFTYSKVADIENGNYILEMAYEESGIDLNQIGTAKEMEEAIGKLEACSADKIPIAVGEDGSLKAMKLEAGVYLVEGISEGNYKIPGVLVTVPTWSEELEETSYEITVIPKLETTPKTVETGDKSNVGVFVALFGISLLFFLGRLCYNGTLLEFLGGMVWSRRKTKEEQ